MGLKLDKIQAALRASEQALLRSQSAKPKLLSVRELADLLGTSVSWVYKARLSGEAPISTRVGRKVKFDLRDVDPWLAKRKQPSTSHDVGMHGSDEGAKS
jgi:excisionase family DNA binding protein